jgi:hypothetical protein
LLEQLDRPDVHVVDAARSHHEVYADITQYLANQMSGDNETLPPDAARRRKFDPFVMRRV